MEKSYCMYLRKSRADAEAEARGEGETLARHRRILMELAKKQGLHIVAEYKEIVSGDSLAARPQMQAMLQAVTEKQYAGVLCMEVERLARGSTIDQGIVAQAFKESGTLIITPAKTYHPDREADEEYFEFSLFMSRREYQTIRRRLQAGRLATVKEGCYIGTNPPYGYKKVTPEPKVHTLEIVPEQAEVVQWIYRMYLEGKGARAISAELNRYGIAPAKSAYWEVPSIKKILTNPIYTGVVQWHVKGSGDTCYPGLHAAIIDAETFQKVQERKKNHPMAQVPVKYTLENYYHNVLYCAECGHQMKRRYIQSSGKAHMLCRCRSCMGKVVSAPLEAVDELLLASIRFRIHELEEMTKKPEKAAMPDKKEDTRKNIQKQLSRIEKQQSKLYDLLEQEIYDTATFLERMQILKEQKAVLEKELSVLGTGETTKRSVEDSIRQLQYVLEHFVEADAEEKNELLHSIVRKIEYYKTKRGCYRNPITDLRLEMDFI